MRQCKICEEFKDESSFIEYKPGLLGIGCRECTEKINNGDSVEIKYNPDNIIKFKIPKHFKNHEEYLQWFRNYREKNKEKFREYNKEYNKQWRHKNGYQNEINDKLKFPEKEKCRYKTNILVKKGIIIKKPCFNCGNKKSQKHHLDYNDPYNIVWCCH